MDSLMQKKNRENYSFSYFISLAERIKLILEKYITFVLHMFQKIVRKQIVLSICIIYVSQVSSTFWIASVAQVLCEVDRGECFIIWKNACPNNIRKAFA